MAVFKVIVRIFLGCYQGVSDCCYCGYWFISGWVLSGCYGDSGCLLGGCERELCMISGAACFDKINCTIQKIWD